MSFVLPSLNSLQIPSLSSLSRHSRVSVALGVQSLLPSFSSWPPAPRIPSQLGKLDLADAASRVRLLPEASKVELLLAGRLVGIVVHGAALPPLDVGRSLRHRHHIVAAPPPLVAPALALEPVHFAAVLARHACQASAEPLP